MHELAITQSLLELVLAEAQKAGAEKVLEVNVVLGEMSGVVDHFIESNFSLLSRDTAASGARLTFHKVPQEARCRRCGHLFHPGDSRWACPECQSPEMEITAGSELYVESIEVS
ncbi:MAG: hydrogenase maturation nickel metallochaperone HypA [Chloroflexota bacterium]